DPGGGDRRRPAGAAVRRGSAGRGLGPGRPPAGAALAVRARRLPQGNRPHRRIARCGTDRDRQARRARRHPPRPHRSVRMSLATTSAAGAPASQRATRAVRAGIDRDPAYGAVTPPLVLSSNFSFAGFAEKRQYDYTRSGNPTRDLLGEALAELEGGVGGVVTATGMGAVAMALDALLQPGGRQVVPRDCYGGSWRLFDALANKGAFERVTCDLTDPRALAEALQDAPKLVWIETPSNPLLRITD